MLSEKTENNYMVLEDGQIQHQVVTIILRDDAEITRLNFRVVYNPDTGVPAGSPGRLLDIAGVVHTPEVVQEYRDKNPSEDQRQNP